MSRTALVGVFKDNNDWQGINVVNALILYICFDYGVYCLFYYGCWVLFVILLLIERRFLCFSFFVRVLKCIFLLGEIDRL